MRYKIIAFDLQGTLTKSSFSDEFWMKTLLKLYAKNKKISFIQAKKILGEKFKNYGKYDYRYYSLRFWLNELKLKLNFEEVCRLIKNKPCFYKDFLKLIKESSKEAKLIIISSTSKDFIYYELKNNKKFFKNIYSSLDDFNIAGKPPKVYLKISKALKVFPKDIIYIGNDFEMDIKNARKAGFDVFFWDNNRPRKLLINELRRILGS
jgi:HAD superfamily hydrolase (TIGR01549 family)